MQKETFKFEYLELPYIKKGHNFAGNNERTVELALAYHFLRSTHGIILEVGAVMPYYPGLLKNASITNLYHLITIDEKDPKADLKKNVDLISTFRNANVLSVSTLEHMGLGEYGGKKDLTIQDRFLRRIIEGEPGWADSGADKFLVTFGIGYNIHTDTLIKERKFDTHYLFMKRIDKYNNWEQCTGRDAFRKKYNDPFKWANSVCIITNML